MIVTLRLPLTVLRSSGECPWTSALGLWTRRNSAGNSNVSPVSNAIVSAALSLRSLNSVGHGELCSGADAIWGLPILLRYAVPSSCGANECQHQGLPITAVLHYISACFLAAEAVPWNRQRV